MSKKLVIDLGKKDQQNCGDISFCFKTNDTVNYHSLGIIKLTLHQESPSQERWFLISNLLLCK